MRPASLLKATVAEGPQPPLEDRTNGVKVPCSTCRTLCSYALLFSLSCLRYVELVEDELLVGAKELNTLTSKKALLWLLSQKFWALMSSLAPSSVLVLRRGKLSPVRGWRVGSRPTFGQTSVRKLAVIPDTYVLWCDLTPSLLSITTSIFG